MRKRPILALLTVLLVAVAVMWYQPWSKVPLLLSQVLGTKLTQPSNTLDQSGIGSQTTKGQLSSGQAVDFTYIDLPKAPQTVQKLAQLNKDKEATALVVANVSPYVVVTRGVKPTAGYGAEISGISLEKIDEKQIINLRIKYTDPQPGQVTAQVLTYPMVIARVDLFSVPQGLVIQVDRN